MATGTLNITNGDCAVSIMQQAKLAGHFLPWRDVLHLGPVPADLNLDELSRRRAEFIAQQGWGDAQLVLSDFQQRDAQLKSYTEFAEVILWFEHDLYDQLQLMQLLDWFADNGGDSANLKLICTDQYLGMLSAEQMADLLSRQEGLSADHFALAKRTWQALRSPTPEALEALLTLDTAIFPFLNNAIKRLLEEYPACSNGLSRTVNQALEIISDDELTATQVFARYQQTEQARFMGDTGFYSQLQPLLDSKPPLLQLTEANILDSSSANSQQLTITDIGRKVLSGKRNFLDIHEIDLWIGGTQLSNDRIWCWNALQSSMKRIK